MEFNEKLQELRKEKGFTQEELAEALYVSRTAVSKWESGRGYPNIGSLMDISRFFSVSVDDLICSGEMISVAESEKNELENRYLSFLCSVLDILCAVLLVIPAFGYGTGNGESLPLFRMNAANPALRVVFAVLIGITVLNGLCGTVIAGINRPVWNRYRSAIGMVLSVTTVAVFIVTRQPYAGIYCFSLLVIKFLLFAGKRQKIS